METKLDVDKIRSVYKTMENPPRNLERNLSNEWRKNKYEKMDNPFYHDVMEKKKTPAGRKELLERDEPCELLDNENVSKILERLANKFEAQKELIVQMVRSNYLNFDESYVRKEVKLMIDYLRYYSTISICNETTNLVAEPVIINCRYPYTSLSRIGYILLACIANNKKIILETRSIIMDFIYQTILECGYNNIVSIYFLYKELNEILEDSQKSYLFYQDGLKNTLEENQKTFTFPMIIFDNGDFESACDTAIDSIWFSCNCNMIQSWVGPLLIQETIFEDAINYLKRILVSESRKSYHLRTVDAAQFGTNIIFNQNRCVIVTGQYNRNILERDEYCNYLTVLPFRTINEAIALANNSRQGTAASVWTQDTSLANEVSQKLQVGNVWINSCYLFKPDIPFTSYKDSKWMYVGGKEGMVQFNFLLKPTVEKYESIDPKSGENFRKILNDMKQKQIKWAKLPSLERLSAFKKVAHGGSLYREFGTSLIKFALESRSRSVNEGDFMVVVHEEPIGVVVIVDKYVTTEKMAQIIAKGNALIVLCDNKSLDMYKPYINLLPLGVMECVKIDGGVFKELARIRDPGVYHCHNGRIVSSKLKNVWYDVGETFP